MIEVIVNRPSFEYDIHSLVKAFFPREDVQVRVQDTFTDDTKIRMTVHGRPGVIFRDRRRMSERKWRAGH